MKLAVLAIMATFPAFADPLPAVTHKDLLASLAPAKVYAAGSLADGRKLELFLDPATCIWTAVVVSRPTGVVTKTSPSVVFGVSDPVCIPAP